MKLLAAAVAFAAAGTLAEPHRLGVHDNPMGAVTDECAEYPPYSNGLWLEAWDPDDRNVPFRLFGVRETVVTDHVDWIAEGTPAMERTYRQGRAQFTIQVESEHWFAAENVLPQVAHALAVMPATLVQRLPHTFVVVGGNGLDGDGRARGGTLDGGVWEGQNQDDGSTRWRLIGSPIFGVVLPVDYVVADSAGEPRLTGSTPTVLLHELAHVLDNRAGVGDGTYVEVSGSPESGDWSSSAPWRSAIAESPCAVSEYATTNALEDFAESVVAWFLFYRARTARFYRNWHDVDTGREWREDVTRESRAPYRRALKERLGRRFALLNRLMHDRFDPLPENLGTESRATSTTLAARRRADPGG